MPVPQSIIAGKDVPVFSEGNFRVIITRTVPVWPKKIFIQWIVKNPVTSLGYTFKVSRSGSPMGPWEDIAQGFDIFFTVDTKFEATINALTMNPNAFKRNLYYRVQVTHTTQGKAEAISQVDAYADQRRTGIIRKLRRDAHVALSKVNGIEIAVFKRRWFGEPCTCKSMTGQTTRAHCATCLGTGIIHGYWNPVCSYANRSIAPVDTQTTPTGIVETRYVHLIMEYIPEVELKDIIVFLRDDKRYIVERVTNTEIQTVCVHQEVDVSEIAKSSVEFNLIADSWRTPPWF